MFSANDIAPSTFKRHKNQEIANTSLRNYLESEELHRLKELREWLRGLQSPNLDPVSTLGIEARNDAELWIKQEYERTEKELKFQREVDAAWKRLMPNILPVNMGAIP